MKRLCLFVLLLMGMLPLCIYGQQPNDPQWYVALDSIEARGAWGLTTGKPSISVAVVDRHFYLGHEDLVNKIDTIWGISGTNTYHGAMVSGLIAAETNNGKGISSIGYNTHLGLYKLNLSEFGTDSTVVHDAVYAAASGNHRVICVCMGKICLSREEVKYFTDQGRIFVLSAGNTPQANSHIYIGNIPGVIIVTALDSTGLVASGCARNQYVDVCAPGNGIVSTYDEYCPYYPYWGMPVTSYATPLVAGTVALMLSVNPDLTSGEIDEILKSSAKDLLLDDPYYVWIEKRGGRLNEQGAGRLNAQAAVQAAIEKGVLKEEGCTWLLPYQEVCASSVLRLGNYADDEFYWEDNGDGVMALRGHTVLKANYAVELYEGFSVQEDAELDIVILE